MVSKSPTAKRRSVHCVAFINHSGVLWLLFLHCHMHKRLVHSKKENLLSLINCAWMLGHRRAFASWETAEKGKLKHICSCSVCVSYWYDWCVCWYSSYVVCLSAKSIYIYIYIHFKKAKHFCFHFKPITCLHKLYFMMTLLLEVIKVFNN